MTAPTTDAVLHQAFGHTQAGRLAEAQRHIDRMLAVKEPRTIENTLRPFDLALEQINSANYFAGLMQQVHPEAKFRDSATMRIVGSSIALAIRIARERSVLPSSTKTIS